MQLKNVIVFCHKFGPQLQLQLLFRRKTQSQLQLQFN